MKEQGMFHGPGSLEAAYSDTLELDLSKVEPSLAGPTRPQDRVPLSQAAKSFHDALQILQTRTAPKAAPKDIKRLETEAASPAAMGIPEPTSPPLPRKVSVLIENAAHELDHGSVVIAAITSCTNTSNPSVMLGAGLLAKRAVERGLQSKPWVKTSLSPGSKAVTDYLKGAGLLPYLEQLRFYLTGYGCQTCIGNAGPLPPPISQAIEENDLVVASVLSGNRNFEGRVHAEVRANYLASPPLVVAYALAGRMDTDLTTEPLGTDRDGKPVYLRDLWPTQEEVHAAIEASVRSETFADTYHDDRVFQGDERWQNLEVPRAALYHWDTGSTYVQNPPYFEGMTLEPEALADLKGMRVLAVLGDSITTDHISPAGTIKVQSPAGKYLMAHGVQPADFNSYGSRRGNHEVMMRGTFANVRLRNRLAPGTEGGMTRHLPDGEQMPIYDAAMKYREEGVPLLILAGKEYGSGSSRDWAAKGPRLLGVRAVIAESYERIHRSNLVGMGILPLQFGAGDSATSLGLTGEEVYDVEGVAELLASGFASGRDVIVRARRPDGVERTFQATVRIDTPQEVLYFQHGGILQYVLRQLVQKK
jgi:aconitate hydratase